MSYNRRGYMSGRGSYPGPSKKNVAGVAGAGCFIILLNLAFYAFLIILAAWAIGKWVV